MTEAEQALWKLLRSRRFEGFKFRRQVPLGPYVADFVCFELHLVVEVDGGQHAVRMEEDAERTRWLEAHGFRVVRFWNSDVLTNLGGVSDVLCEHLGIRERDAAGRVRGSSGLAGRRMPKSAEVSPSP